MNFDNKYMNELHEAEGPAILEDQVDLATKMGFKHRSGVGELLFADITCRPEIIYTVVKLSQFLQ